MPNAAAGVMSGKLIADAELKIYPGASHGLTQLNAEQFNKDVLAFIQQ